MKLMMELLPIIKHALVITFFVFTMMVLVDFIDTAGKRWLSRMMKGGQWRQYTLASFLGSTPGCLGAFMNVSLYVHGMISFGAIVGGMIATSGDEAFVMLVQFPGAALALFVLLFIAGIIFAWISDKLAIILGIVPCESCQDLRCDDCESDRAYNKPIVDLFHATTIVKNIQSLSFTRFLLLALIVGFLFLVIAGILGPPTWNWKRTTFGVLSVFVFYIALVVSEHYLHDHIWGHIIKKHIFRVFLWTLGALLFLHFSLKFWDLNRFIHSHMFWVLLIAGLMGVIPESGPHLIFVMMYAQGLLPFSILFTASFVQDGHGMLPLLSYSLKDSVLIKVFNLAFGLIAGGLLFALGL
jgi:hypothetical protein